VYLEHLSLTNFRNYARLELSLPSKPIVLHGQNAQGKTSLLEAIYYLATSHSPYTNSLSTGGRKTIPCPLPASPLRSVLKMAGFIGSKSR